MAVRGKRAHYRLNETTGRHGSDVAGRSGIPGKLDSMQQLIAVALRAIDRLEDGLPRGFPERVYMAIRQRVHRQAKRFEHTLVG
jgi:hypothetical protein